MEHPGCFPHPTLTSFRQAAALEVKAAQEQSNHFRTEYPIHALKFDYKFKQNKKPFSISAIYHDDRLTYIHSDRHRETDLLRNQRRPADACQLHARRMASMSSTTLLTKAISRLASTRPHLRGRESDHVHHANIPPVHPNRPSLPPPLRRSATSELLPQALFRSRCNRGFSSGIIVVVAVGLWFSGMGKKTKSTTGTGSATAGQVKPVVGGLTPDEVQTRLQESEETRRSEAANSRPARPHNSRCPS